MDTAPSSLTAQPMHALVSWWQLPETCRGGSPLDFDPPMVDLIRESPGFMESYWTYERSNGKSVGFTLLDTAEHAHDLRNAIESHVERHIEGNVQPRIRLEMIRVHEITAHTAVEAVEHRTGPIGGI